MTTLECGPNGNFPEGSLREVTFEQGEMLVNTRHAEWVDKGVSAAEAAAAEAAAAEAAAAEAAAAEAAAAEAAALVGDEAANLAAHDAEEKRKAADAAKPKHPARR